jgi:hypothetical protein
MRYLVPVEISLRGEYFSAMAEQLFRRFDRPDLEVNPFVFRQVAVTTECLAAHVARQRSLAAV